MLQKLIPIIHRHETINKSLLENTAITLGRLGLVAPDLAASVLANFITPWCVALRSIRDDVEKEHAFLGLCGMIRLNPHAPLGDEGRPLLQLCDAFASWSQPPAELNQQMRVILDGYKTSLGDRWANFYTSFPNDLRQRLAERYGL